MSALFLKKWKLRVQNFEKTRQFSYPWRSNPPGLPGKLRKTSHAWFSTICSFISNTCSCSWKFFSARLKRCGSQPHVDQVTTSWSLHRTTTMIAELPSPPADLPAEPSKAAKKAGERKDSTCSLCGLFSLHTVAGHQTRCQALFSVAFNENDLRQFTVKNIMVSNRLPTQDEALYNKVLEACPQAAGKSAESKLLGCAGRNFYALLLHEIAIIKKHSLPWITVFQWACMISSSNEAYVQGELPDSILAHSVNSSLNRSSTSSSSNPSKPSMPDDEDDHELKSQVSALQSDSDSANDSDAVFAALAKVKSREKRRSFTWNNPDVEMNLQAKKAKLGGAHGEEMVPVSATIPKKLVGKFYEMVGKLFQE